MKISSIYSEVGFQEIYTHEDSLPQHIDLPEKKPFIILVIPDNSPNNQYLEHHFPLFQKLGYTDVIDQSKILTITSKRKVEIVINAILSSVDYNHSQNEELLNKLRLMQQELTQIKKPKMLPPKSKSSANYHSVNAQIIREKQAPTPNHSAKKVKKDDKPAIEILKIEGSGRKITEIEAFNGISYRLLLNGRTPRVRSVHDAKGNRVGVLSREIEHFQSLHDYYLKEKKKTGRMCSPKQRDLVKSGIGRVLAAAYCEEENDLHGGNIGYDPIEIKAYKIDHDQATWPLTSKYRGINPNKPYYGSIRVHGIKPKDAFPITQRDITNFPYLKDAKPRAFPDKADNALLDLNGIENDPNFIKDAFSVFLKRALFDEQIYRPIANATIGSPKLREELVAHKSERSALLREELIRNEKFLNFLIDNPNLKAQIMDEFREYNNDYKEDSSLRLNLDALGNKFDALVGEALNNPVAAVRLIEVHYKPYLDNNSYQYKEVIDSSVRKQATKEFIKSMLHVNDTGAEFYFNQAKEIWLRASTNSQENIIARKAESTLEDILADIIKLDGKIGVFGGEQRTLANGDEINIPKGAAAIFDLYKKYKDHEIPTAIETLEAMIEQAAISNAYKGHTWFNRRQNETSDFYNHIVAIQHRTFVEESMNQLLTIH